MPEITENPLFDRQQLSDDLERLLPGSNVQLNYLLSCDSTNKQCMQTGRDALVVISEHQTAGRGRRGKPWHSPERQNLYCSIGLEKIIKPEQLGMISLLVGVCIADVLHQQGYAEVSLKWPNDVLMQGKKLGGILIETRPLESNRFYLVIGIGLNLKLCAEELQKIDQPAISLYQAAAVEVDQQQLVTHLISRVMQAVQDYQPEVSEMLLQRFKQYDHLLDKPVEVKTLTENLSGHYAGLLENGQVCVTLAQGVRCFVAAEISIRESESHATD